MNKSLKAKREHLIQKRVKDNMLYHSPILGQLVGAHRQGFADGVAAVLESPELQGLVTVLVHLQDEFKSFPDRSGGYCGCGCKDDLEEILEHCDEKYNRYDVIGKALEQWAQFRGSDE